MKLPKLNLRDMFGLVVVVAMGLGWWLDRSNVQTRVTEMEDDLWKKAEANLLLGQLEFEMKHRNGGTTAEISERMKAILRGEKKDQ